MDFRSPILDSLYSRNGHAVLGHMNQAAHVSESHRENKKTTGEEDIEEAHRPEQRNAENAVTAKMAALAPRATENDNEETPKYQRVKM